MPKSKRPIRLGKGSLSDKIYAGRLSKDGRTWLDGKCDVTSDFWMVLIQMLSDDDGNFYSRDITIDGENKITVALKPYKERDANTD